MFIGNAEIKNNVVLAPMAGVSDVSFRELCAHFGAGITYTEMVSVKGLLYANKNTKLLLKTFDGEHPVAVQLFGHDPDDFKKVLSSGILDGFDIIDLNMGCPAPKIVKNGDGSALLKNFELASKIISTCAKSTSKPVTVKFRKGFGADDDVLVEFAKMCQKAGASAITIHPRSQAQGYSGRVDICDIKKVKDAVSIPVIGNGDVVDEQSFNKMKEVCDLVMIGRASVGHPEIFCTVFGKNPDIKGLEIAKLHLQIMQKYYDDEYIAKIFKRHAFSYVDGEVGAVEKRKKIALAKTLSEIKQILFD